MARVWANETATTNIRVNVFNFARLYAACAPS